MERQGWMDGMNRFLEWFMNIAYLNILWILFTLAGGVVLGAAPATSALFSLTRKLLAGEKLPIFKSFFKYYRKDFLKVNCLFYFLLFIGAILYIDIVFLMSIDHAIAQILTYLLLVISVIYLLTCIMVFPVFSHYDLSFLGYIKHSLFIGTMKFYYIFIMLIGIITSYYLMLFVPALLLFFGISLGALIVMSVSFHVFTKIEQTV